jgi:streptomycin 6-kinase
MADILTLIWGTLAAFFRARADLQTEIIALSHQHTPLLGGLHHHNVRI